MKNVKEVKKGYNIVRSKRAFINTLFSVLNQVILAFVNIVIRKVMIISIGSEYLGVNGLFSNVLSLLSLTESGFGIAIVYKLYRPIAENNEKKIGELLHFYSRIYKIIAVAITVVGLVFIPILPHIIKETTLHIKDLRLYYILFLLNSVAGYFVAYKTAFLTACQQNYYIMVVNTIITVLTSGIRIIALIIFESYILYIIAIILNTILINIITSVLANKKYPYLKKIKEYQLATEEKRLIYNDCKALFFHKIGAYVLTGTDNILISTFVNLISVGLYSNYLIVINLINNVLSKIFDSTVPAVGNILAINGKKAVYESFKMLLFFDFLIQTFCTLMLSSLLQSFVKFVFGKNCLLDFFTVSVIIANFYFTGMRRPVTVVKNAVGIFIQDRYFALFEAAINLVISLIGVILIGMPGIFIGTIFSGLFIPNIVGPYFLYKDVFQEKFRYFFTKMIQYYFFSFITVFITYDFLRLFSFPSSLIGFVLEFIVTLAFSIGMTMLIAIILPERKYFIKYFKIICQAIKSVRS